MSQERSFTHWSLRKLQHLQHLQHLRCQTHWLQHRSTTCQGNSVDLWTCGSVKHRSRLHWSCQDQTRTTVDSVDSWSQKIQERSSSKPATNHWGITWNLATPVLHLKRLIWYYCVLTYCIQSLAWSSWSMSQLLKVFHAFAASPCSHALQWYLSHHPQVPHAATCRHMPVDAAPLLRCLVFRWLRCSSSSPRFRSQFTATKTERVGKGGKGSRVGGRRIL